MALFSPVEISTFLFLHFQAIYLEENRFVWMLWCFLTLQISPPSSSELLNHRYTTTLYSMLGKKYVPMHSMSKIAQYPTTSSHILHYAGRRASLAVLTHNPECWERITARWQTKAVPIKKSEQSRHLECAQITKNVTVISGAFLPELEKELSAVWRLTVQRELL